MAPRKAAASACVPECDGKGCGERCSVQKVLDCLPCWPENVEPECIILKAWTYCNNAAFGTCDWISNLVDDGLGGPALGENGKEAESNPRSGDPGAPGEPAEDGYYVVSGSFGVGVDAAGMPGVSASIECPGQNEPGGTGGIGQNGGDASDGAATGGRGHFGFLQGGQGGAATFHAAHGGHGGAGGRGGDAALEYGGPCGLERARAGRGGWGGTGGDSGSGKALGGEGGASLVSPGSGGPADGTTADPGPGGYGGDGGLGKAITYCKGSMRGDCIYWGDAKEPDGPWGCGGLSGAGKNIRIQGGLGGMHNTTHLRLGLPGSPAAETEVAGQPGGTRQDHGSGSPREPGCSTNQDDDPVTAPDVYLALDTMQLEAEQAAASTLGEGTSHDTWDD